MKKIFIILFTIAITFSLFACGTQNMYAGNAIADSNTTQASPETTPSDGATEQDEPKPEIPFKYKMAEIKEKYRNGKTVQHFYVVEFLHNEHSAATFVPVFSDGRLLTDIYPTAQVDVYSGHICDNDFITHTEMDTSLYEYRELITLVITTNGDFSDSNKLSFNTSVMHRESGRTEDITLSVNDTIDNITTQQNIICGKTLIKLNDDYYVFYRTGSGESEKPFAHYTSYALIPLGRQHTTLSEKFSQNVSFASSKNEPLNLLEGYEVYFTVNSEGYDIGIQCTMEAETTEDSNAVEDADESAIKLIAVDNSIMDEEIFLVFTDVNGNEINFLTNIKKSS